MGKKRIAKKGGGGMDQGLIARSLSRAPRKRAEKGVLHVQATYNNTKLLLTDASGNALVNSSSGGLGFRGAKKGTPFAAAKVGEMIGDKAHQMNMKEVTVIVKGIGAGRESAIRAFAGKGLNIITIRDETPIPFNGPRPRKPRRV